MRQRVATWFQERRSWCMSLLRIYLGVGLVFKAVSFIANRDAFVQMMLDHHVLFAGAVLAHVIILTHFCGGTLMAIGWGTRLGALIQVPNLIGATFFVNWTGGIMGFAEEMRFSALVLFVLLLFVWHGSGPLSLEARFARSPVGD